MVNGIAIRQNWRTSGGVSVRSVRQPVPYFHIEVTGSAGIVNMELPLIGQHLR